MDRALSTAIAGAVVNVVLSTIVPCLVKDRREFRGPLVSEVVQTFQDNSSSLLTSSLVTAIAVYLAVLMEPEVKKAIPSGIVNFLR